MHTIWVVVATVAALLVGGVVLDKTVSKGGKKASVTTEQVMKTANDHGGDN